MEKLFTIALRLCILTVLLFVSWFLVAGALKVISFVMCIVIDWRITTYIWCSLWLITSICTWIGEKKEEAKHGEN